MSTAGCSFLFCLDWSIEDSSRFFGVFVFKYLRLPIMKPLFALKALEFLAW